MSDDHATTTVDLPLGSFKDKSLDEILTLTDRRIQGSSAVSLSTTPRVLAQVLGFKFAHYQVGRTNILLNESNELCKVSRGH